MRRSETRRVVHAVANHGHLVALVAECLDRGDLALGRKPGLDLVESNLARHRLRRMAAIAGEHDRLDPAGAELGQHVARLGADLIAQQDASDQSAGQHPYFRQFRRRRRQIPRPARQRALFQEFAPPQKNGGPFVPTPQSLAGDGREFLDRQFAHAAPLSILCDRTGDRVLGVLLQRIRKLDDILLAARGKTLEADHSQFASGQRSGLVEGHEVDLRQFLDCRASAEQDAIPGAPGDGGKNRGRD